MEQCEWTLRLPNPKPLSPREGRHMVARLADDLPGLEAIFNYDGGRALSGAPAETLKALSDSGAGADLITRVNNDAAWPRVRVGALGSTLRITAVHAELIDAVDAAALPIAAVLRREMGAAPELRRSATQCFAVETDRPFHYECAALLPVRGVDATARFLASSRDAQAVTIRRRILDGLDRQARILGIDLPAIDSDLETIEFETPRDCPFVLRERAGRSVPVNKAVLVPRVRFIAHVRLGGHWAVGHATGRHNGRIWYARDGR